MATDTAQRWLSNAVVDAAILAACILAAAGLSLALGQDANWDLQNYHFYNPWAWMAGARAYAQDMVAAQLQTYHNPLPDLPFYAMVSAGWEPTTIAMAMAIPAAVAAFLLWKLATRLFRSGSRTERFTAIACAFLIGTTSGIGFGVLGTTMNEWPGTALIMASLYVIVRRFTGAGARKASPAAILAGLLAGCATGIKLTFGVYAIAICAGLLLCAPTARKAITDAMSFGLAVLAGTAISAGAWMWSLLEHFGNPIFPYANKWFNSPWWGQQNVLHRPFGPHTLGEWIVFPFSLSAPPAFFVTEVSYVDGRIAAVYGLTLVALVAALLARRRDPWTVSVEWRFLAAFAVASFVLWTALYSLLRYLLPLLLLSGAFIVALLSRLVQPAARVPAYAMSALLLVATTTVPDWWRTGFGARWFEVDLPKLDRNALVLLTSDAPMSYVLPFFPDDASFLGINNNISDARRRNLLEQTIRQRIGGHAGPLYSLSYPQGSGVDALLERQIYKITETCLPIVTNMRTSPMEICRVVQAR